MQAEKFFEDALLAQQQNNVDLALDLFAAAITANPRHAAAWMFRGLLEDKQGRQFNAMLHIEQSLSIDDKRQDAWCNIGIIAANLGLHDKAEFCLKKSLELGDAFEPHMNLGDLYIRLMRLTDAQKEYAKAIKLNPQSADAHGNYARVLIAQGWWNKGHQENQWRHKAMYPPRPRQLYPAWEGQPLGHKTILLYPEGGYGDEILGLRYAMALHARYPSADIVLEARAPLFSLFRSSVCGIGIIPQHSEPTNKPSFCCGLSDLPLWLGTKPETVPLSRGYLKAPPGPSFDLPDGPKVGLCWLAGKRPLQPWTDRLSRIKSIPLEQLAGLADCDVTLVSLQLDRGDPVLMQKLGIVPMPEVHDFADTARLIGQLDLVISIDSAVAHLAGALGYPVWNLIRFNEIVTYPPGAVFYDSMQFYRQDKIDDWSGAISRLAKDLHAWRAERIAA